MKYYRKLNFHKRWIDTGNDLYKIVNDASRQAKRNVIPEVFNIMNLEDIISIMARRFLRLFIRLLHKL